MNYKYVLNSYYFKLLIDYKNYNLIAIDLFMQKESLSDSAIKPLTYKAPWNMYAMGFSYYNRELARMAIASHNMSSNNFVEIIQLDNNMIFNKQLSISIDCPTSKVMFCPD